MFYIFNVWVIASNLCCKHGAYCPCHKSTIVVKHWPTLPAQKGEIDKSCIIREGFEHGVFMLLFSLLYILFAGGKNATDGGFSTAAIVVLLMGMIWWNWFRVWLAQVLACLTGGWEFSSMTCVRLGLPKQDLCEVGAAQARLVWGWDISSMICVRKN